MNVHDSERLAGLLLADGLVPTDDEEQADVVVLNTCCIRENADQRLYGTLGRLKELVDAKPGLQIAVGGCLAQKDRARIQEKVGWVDVVFGTHNLTSAPGLLERARTEGLVTLKPHLAKPFEELGRQIDSASLESGDGDASAGSAINPRAA